MTVDSTLLEAGRLHQVIEGAALVPSLIENRRGCLYDLFPGLLAFGHKVACALTIRDQPVLSYHSLPAAWMHIESKQSQATRNLREKMRPIGPIGIQLVGRMPGRSR